MHETIEELLDHPPGAGVRRALHPGRRARTRAGAHQHQRVHPRGEGPDRRADRRLPVQPRLRQDPVATGEARHRRAPRRDAAEVPPPRRAARPGRPAQGHLRHRHPRRRHQRADPHGGVHRPVASTTDAVSGCSRRASSTRSPDAPDGPASTPPGTVVVQAPEHVVENHRLVLEGRRRPQEAQAGAAQEGARGAGDLDRGHVRPAGRRRARGAGVPDAGHPRDAAQRDRPRGRPVRGDAAAAARQPRGPPLAGAAGPPGRRAVPRAARRRGRRARRPARRRTAARSGSSRACSSASR